MHRLSRRAWLRWCAAAAAAATCGPVRAACDGRLLPPRDDARPAIAFIDDRDRPQGTRLEELRQRLAAHGLGEERLRLEAIAAAGEDLGCVADDAALARPLALCTASAGVARALAQRASEVPLVFAIHGDPVALGVVDSLGVRRTNATGFTFETPVSPDLKALEILSEAFPEVRRVLVLADAAWARDPARAAQLQRVRERLHLQVAVAAAPRDPAAELQRLGPAGSVAAYLPSSELLLLGAPELLAALHRLRVPHLGGDERLLRHGAMLTLAPRRFAHWDVMASMLRALAAGTPAREMPVQWPIERLLSVSLAPWQRMGLAPPPRLLRRAHVIG